MVTSGLGKLSQRRIYCKYTLGKIVYKNKWEKNVLDRKRNDTKNMILFLEEQRTIGRWNVIL